MLVTTHSLVSMALVVTTGNPAIYIPASIVNHPILDSIPHFGFPPDKYSDLRPKALWPMFFFDLIFGTSVFFLVLAKTGLPFWLLFSVCLLSAWPDLVTFYQRRVNPKFAPKFLEIHEGLQRESPWFFWVDLSIILICLWLILSYS